MDVFEREADLGEPVEDVVFRPVLQLAAVLLLLLVLILYSALEVTAVRVVHHNAEFALFGLVNLLESDDVGMTKHFEDFGFSQGVSPLILVHLLDVDLPDDGVVLVGLAFDEVSGSEGADA